MNTLMHKVHALGFFLFFYFTYLPWEISVITGFHYLPANKYNGDVVLHIHGDVMDLKEPSIQDFHSTLCLQNDKNNK